MSKDKTSTTAKKSRFKRTVVPDPQALVSAFLPEARAKFLPKARAKQATLKSAFLPKARAKLAKSGRK